MAVSLNDLKAYLGTSTEKQDVFLMGCLEEAKALVDKFNKKYDTVSKGYIESDAPTGIVERCYLIVAADLYERRKAPNGIANQQFASADGIGQAPMRIARDPMAGVYPILRRWVGFL